MPQLRHVEQAPLGTVMWPETEGICQAFDRRVAIVGGDAGISELGCGEGIKAIAQTEATFDTVWNAFRALSPEARNPFVEKLVADTALREELEDLMDARIATERLFEPVRPLDEVLDELGKT